MLDKKSTRLHLSGLPEFVGMEEISRYLSGYGTIVEAKIRSGYGFVQFENEKDASDVVEIFRDELFLGSHVSVEFANPLRDAHKAPRMESIRTREILPRYPVLISNMAPGTCWQELKDFGRQAGGFVAFCNINKPHNGSGFLEYTSRDAARRAVRKLNGLSLRGQKVKLSIKDVRKDENRTAKTCHCSRSRSPYRHRTTKERRTDDALDNTTNRDERHRIDRGETCEDHTHEGFPRASTRSSRTESYTAGDSTRYQPKVCSYNSIATSNTDPYVDKTYTPHDPGFSHRLTRFTLDQASPFSNAREPEPYYETQYDQYPRERYHYDWHDTYRYDPQAYFDRR